MEDGDVLFRALVARRQAVHDLLVATSELSAQLTGLVKDTRADLKPALDNLKNVLDMLQRQPREPRRAACGCWRRSTGCSPTRWATARGSTRSSRTCRPCSTSIGRSLRWRRLPKVGHRCAAHRRRSPSSASLVIAAVVVLRPARTQKLITASFPRTVSHLRGLRRARPRGGIGEVETVSPAGTTVKVDDARTTPTSRSRPTPRPSSSPPRSSATGTSSYPGVHQAARCWRTARRSTPTAPPYRSSSTRSTRASTTSPSASARTGANKEGALTRLLDVHRTQLRRPGRAVQRDGPQPEPVHRHPRQQQGRAVRDRAPRSSGSSPRWPRTTRRSGTSTTAWPRRRTSWRGSGTTWPRPCATSAIAMEQVVVVRQGEQGRAVAATSRGWCGVSDVLVKQRAALEETLDGGADRPGEPLPHLQPAPRHAGHPGQPAVRASRRSRPTRQGSSAR